MNQLSKKNHAMRRGIRKPHKLKVRNYADRLIDLNEYVSDLPVGKASDKIGETELNEIPLNSMPNLWGKQAYVQGFYCGTITFEKDVSIFECMEIAETIYEGVVVFK